MNVSADAAILFASKYAVLDSDYADMLRHDDGDRAYVSFVLLARRHMILTSLLMPCHFT